MPVVGPKLNSKSSNIALKPIVVVEEVTILKIFNTTTFHLLIIF